LYDIASSLTNQGGLVRTKALVGAGIVGGIAAAYIAFIRPRQMRWGATTEEATRILPYDGLVQDPTWSSTRAVTIEATPEQIWPWLVQLGWGRGGWYSYDWVDNGGKPSAWEILPEHQHLAIGTRFPMSPWTAMYCRDFDEPRWLLMRMGDEAGKKDIGTFLYYLDPIDRSRTRVLIRMRDKYRWLNPPVLAMQLAVDVGDIIFQRKHLLGLKARAEMTARSQAGGAQSEPRAAVAQPIALGAADREEK
jgi:hypothetical protein